MFKNKRGIAMLIVLSLILMLLTLTGAALVLSSGHFSTSYKQIERTRAFYAAEAALQHALWMCRTGNLPSGCDLDSGCSGAWPITDTETIRGANYSFNVEIEIWEIEADPGTGISAPTGTHPVVAKVKY